MSKVLFVCLHGAAKSVVAAEHFRRLAAAHGHTVDVSAAGVEPDVELNHMARAGLAADGFSLEGMSPRPLTPEALGEATVVVSFGYDLGDQARGRPVVRWDGVPAVSDGY